MTAENNTEQTTGPRSGWLAVGVAAPVLDGLLTLLWMPGPSAALALHLLALAAAALAAFMLWRGWRACDDRAARLEDGINALEEGFALHDAEDRLLLVNDAYRRMYAGSGSQWKLGQRFEDMLRASVFSGEIVAATGQEEEWIKQRLAMHANPGPSWIQALANGNWVRVHEQRTAGGNIVGLRSDVSELVRTQHALARAQEQAQQERQLLERAVDAMPVGIEIYDGEDRLILANRRVKEWYPYQDFNQPGRSFESLLKEGYAAGALPVESEGHEDEWIRERLAERGKRERPLLQHWASGLWLMTHERRTPEGYLVAARQDVSELMHKERALQASQAQLQAIIGTAGVSILTLDAEGRIRSANPATERMLGYSHEELVDQDVGLLMDGSTRSAVTDFMRSYLAATTQESREMLARQREFGVLHKSGRELTVQLALAEVRSGDERLFVAVLTDITERKRFEIELQHANEQLLRLSTTDPLTELANRRLLMHRLEDEWRRALRSREPLSLLLVDVDFFKLYNDHYGHQAGDLCLTRVARALEACAHRPSDLAARYGGEEFVLLLPQTDAAGAHAVAQRCLAGMREAAVEHRLSPLGPHVTLSVGVVSGVASASGSAAQWLAQADLALYQAKAQGRNRVVQAPGY